MSSKESLKSREDFACGGPDGTGDLKTEQEIQDPTLGVYPDADISKAVEDDDVVIEYPSSVYADGKEQWVFVFCVALAANCSTISIPIYFPTLTVLAESFHTSVERINVTATVYSIFQGVSPILWATISDTWGRRPIYFICITIYLCANVGLALAPNYAALLCLRCLQAFGGASTVSLTGGVVGDFTTRRTRGSLIGISTGAGLLGNCFGPLIGGGIMQQWNTWRAIFWFLAIFAGVVLVLIGVLLPETNRHIVGTGARAPPPRLLNVLSRSPYAWVRHNIKGVPYSPTSPEYEKQWTLPPGRIKWFRWAELFFQPDVLLVLIPTSLHYTTWYMVLTAQSTILSNDYNFTTLMTGYTYLASGVGTFGGSFATGKLMQWNYRRMAARNPTRPDIYRARLEFAFHASALVVITTIVFGWTLHYHVSFYVPVVMSFFISLGATQFLNSTSALLVDLFPEDSAASQSCNNLARCLLCAAGLAAVDRMMQTMTIGGTFTFMAGLCALSAVCVWIELRWGERLAASRIQKQTQQMRQLAKLE